MFVCLSFFRVGDYGPKPAKGPYCDSRARHSADQWGWDVQPEPAALCQWGTLTLVDGAAVCQDWPRLVCGVHYRACDSSRGGEQCVILIMLRT